MKKVGSLNKRKGERAGTCFTVCLAVMIPARFLVASQTSARFNARCDVSAPPLFTNLQSPLRFSLNIFSSGKSVHSFPINFLHSFHWFYFSFLSLFFSHFINDTPSFFSRSLPLSRSFCPRSYGFKRALITPRDISYVTKAARTLLQHQRESLTFRFALFVYLLASKFTFDVPWFRIGLCSIVRLCFAAKFQTLPGLAKPFDFLVIYLFFFFIDFFSFYWLGPGN